MSKRESISRYSLIIKLLRKRTASFEEISQSLEIESEIQDQNYRISKRTFQRDINDIHTLYNINIRFDRFRNVYYIDYDENPEVNERILEAFDIFSAFNMNARISEFVHFDRRRPEGTENLYGILHAIRNNFQVRFSYQKFSNEAPTLRTLEPYALKEFKYRWYLVGKNLDDGLVKTFGLDRIAGMEILRTKFTPMPSATVSNLFKDCFGIVRSLDTTPKEVVLSFTPEQGNYIKTLPFHHSQKTLVDNAVEFRISLRIQLTYDFVNELLSMGSKVRVMKPQELIDELVWHYETAIGHYKKGS